MEERSNWQQVFSKTKQRFYWFNQANGKTQWLEPAGHTTNNTLTTSISNGQDTDAEQRNNKRKRDETLSVGTDGSRAAATTTPSSRSPKVAIIVPYRDLHIEQKRADHLARFIPEMARYVVLTHRYCMYVQLTTHWSSYH